ncbi:phosphatase 2C [Musa troglodytarum]|uniref:protein-serine/threonine phosphatase n=1 Tax=Musa troglodytarum TaxID=320322 RepID=A0A9E7IB33_9LILI|nr:phosphatase 2C [Musa troglodytarum]
MKYKTIRFNEGTVLSIDGLLSSPSAPFRTQSKRVNVGIPFEPPIPRRVLWDALTLQTRHLGRRVEFKLGETYQKTDSDFLEAERNTFRDDGSMALTAILIGNCLYVANVGDSRTVISKEGEDADDGSIVCTLYFDSENLLDFRMMLVDCKHFEFARTWKVRVVLAMSRAFGNCLLEQCVVAEPEIRVIHYIRNSTTSATPEEEVDEHLELLVLASNGLWDVVAHELYHCSKCLADHIDMTCPNKMPFPLEEWRKNQKLLLGC